MRLICMGDSLTEGYAIDLKQAWCNQLKVLSHMEVINAGISGDTTGGMLARFMRDVIDRRPDHVFIMGGTNDFFMGLPSREPIANIYAMIHQAKHYGIECTIGIPTCAYEVSSSGINEEIAEMKKYRKELIEFCKDHEYHYIDMAQDMNSEHYLDDGVHPSEAGHSIMYDNFINGWNR